MEQTIDFDRFKQLLATLENSEVAIRIRMSGEQWNAFSQVLLLSENAMILQEDGKRRIVMNLKNIAEFEIDSSILDLEPNLRYGIDY
ncbi:MAG: hypothetical protein WA874_17125 [Chryseosolibacter sp.]